MRMREDIVGGVTGELLKTQFSTMLSRWNFHPKLEVPKSTLDFRFVLECVEHLKYNTVPKA